MIRHSVLLLGVFLGAATATAAEGDAAKELAPTLEKYTAAYNTGSVNQVMDFWTENADFVDIRGNFHQGRDLIAALFRRGFADNPGRTIKMTSDACKQLAPEVIMDDGVLELTSANGDVARGRYAVVWTKQDGAWRIRSARDIPLEVEEAPQEKPALEDLSWLVGRWEAKSDKYQITLDCDWQLAKNFLVQRFHITSNEDDFEVVTWIAFDPAEGRFRSWYFDSRGGYGGGPWTLDGSVWRIGVTAVLPDGRIGTSVMSWERLDGSTARWSSTAREVAGEPLPDSEQTYARVAEKPKAQPGPKQAPPAKKAPQ